MVSRPNRCSQSTMTLSCSLAKTWVKTHYERHEEGVVAKSVMYKHYEDQCRVENRNNMETSIFGRVVKSVFPDVTIRRLGGRENLKYYYCGIRAKESSPYAIDNSTTTRPKRRLRKRELVTDKTEVENCLRWLHANYIASNESSVVKTDVYDGYLIDSKNRGAEPLSIQYFGMVVTHAFPNVTKRKLGPRTNQQKYYFGMQERPDPMPPELVPGCVNIDDVFKPKAYRDAHLDDEDDDELCRSPISDGIPDMPQAGLAPMGFSNEMGASPSLAGYPYDPYALKDDSEPVDYTLQSLKLKDEILDEEEIRIKEEPLDLHIARDSCERRTPERPPSTATYGSGSPSPPVKESMKTKKIYKPRFHFDYHDESSWNADQEPKIDSTYFETVHSQSDSMLKNWLMQNTGPFKHVSVNRDQLYEAYKTFCEISKLPFLPLTSFDETILKSFENVRTMIHSSRKTYYVGIRVLNISPLFKKIEEHFNTDEANAWMEASPEHSMELSPGDGSVSDPAGLYQTLLDEEEPDEIEESEDIEENFSASPYPSPSTAEDEIHSTGEVLRDGKFYLRQWLMDNFEAVPDSCLLKADAYGYYTAYARSISQTAFEMNVFGKIVRQVFPNVSIRRLGGRLKPQYHYCGIAPKPSSPLYQYMSGRDPAQRSRKKEIATDNKSAEIVIDFLKSSYESGKSSILKSVVYSNYTQHCTNLRESPVTLNYFGKLVKYCFPTVEVRKSGGKSEPTWFYYGLDIRPRGFPYHSGITGLSHHESKDGIPNILRHSNSEVTSSLPLPNGSMEVGMSMPRHVTSPIPICLSGSSAHIQLGTPTGNSYGSPTPSILLQNPQHQHHNLQQHSFRLSPFVHNSPKESFEHHQHHHRVGSPLEGNHFFRENQLTHHPAEEVDRRPIQVRSPYDHSDAMYNTSHPQASQLLLVPGDIYPREHPSLNIPHHNKFPPTLGGQIVPSQTPPKQVTDQAMALLASKRDRRQFTQQDEYEIYDVIPME